MGGRAPCGRDRVAPTWASSPICSGVGATLVVAHAGCPDGLVRVGTGRHKGVPYGRVRRASRRSEAKPRWRLKDTAYYYPAPYWLAAEGHWIKSLLLFFDDVAILLPDYMWGHHRDADPSLAGPLEEQGLLRILEPKEWIDAEVAERLAEVMVDLLAGGVFDGLPEAHFAELSQSRMG